MRKEDLLLNGPVRATCTIILAHGAGAAMDTPFMNFFAAGLGARGYRVARFEFPYMAARRATGAKRGPDREPVLRDAWHAAIRLMGGKQRLVIGGKSMGGRIASLIADEAKVDGLVCLGYPFHPVGQPERLRIEHLKEIRTPALIVQGTRDPFGKPEEVATYPLAKQLAIHWLDDGDHSFKPRKSAGRTEQQNWEEGIEVISRFLEAFEN